MPKATGGNNSVLSATNSGLEIAQEINKSGFGAPRITGQSVDVEPKFQDKILSDDAAKEIKKMSDRELIKNGMIAYRTMSYSNRYVRLYEKSRANERAMRRFASEYYRRTGNAGSTVIPAVFTVGWR